MAHSNKLVEVVFNFDPEHEYIKSEGILELVPTVGARIALYAGGRYLSDSLSAENRVCVRLEICEASHRLLEDNYDAFMDAVFGPGFSVKRGISDLHVSVLPYSV